MGRKLLAVIYTVMLIAPTYAALEACGGMTAFAMITVIMLLP